MYCTIVTKSKLTQIKCTDLSTQNASCQKHLLHLEQVLITIYLDVNECETLVSPCADNATCIDTEGSYTCTCIDGFQGNGTYCEGQRQFFFVNF